MATLPELPQPDGIDTPTARSNTSLMTVVWQRKSLVILGVVIGMVVGTLIYANRTPVYQSNAQVLIVKRTTAPGTTPGGMSATAAFIEDYMSTQAVLLRSQVIAERTANSEKIKTRLADVGLKSFPEANKPDDLVSGIMLGLTVTRENKEASGAQTGNNVMTLTFRGTNQEECQFILQNLIDMYQHFIDETYQDISRSMLEQIDKMKNEIESKIVKAEQKYNEFLKTTPVILSKFAGGTSALQKQVSNLADKVAILKNEIVAKENELTKIKAIKAEHGSKDVIQYIMQTGQLPKVFNEPELDKNLAAALMEERRLLSMYAENHPDVKRQRQMIEMMRNMFGKGSSTTTPNGQDQDLADKFINGQEIALKLSKELLSAYEAEYDKNWRDLRSHSQFEVDEKNLEGELMRARGLFDEVKKRVDDMNMRKDSGGFRAAIITRPGFGFKIAPMAYQVFTGAALLGLLLGVGLAYLAEVSDKSFRNPTEIRKRLGLPVIGHIPAMAADEKAQQLVAAGSTTIDPMLVTHYQSNSVAAEAYRGVRTALYFSTQGAGHQVIQVTSPNVSDGKSTLAANLAVSIAQSGKRTLLIDCDFRKPRVHKIFNVSAQLGFASAMAGQSDLPSAIQQTAVPNLSVLPCGPRPVNPAELLTSPKFSELIEQLRQMYDFVIVDTPPILVVTDPAVVAPRVDGVVLCIRVTKNGRPFAERAREVLTSLGANILGVVVNGFGTQVGGGKYGYEHYNYGYGEGYSYTYGYTYGYSDKEAASYYGNLPDEHAPAAKS